MIYKTRKLISLVSKITEWTEPRREGEKKPEYKRSSTASDKDWLYILIIIYEWEIKIGPAKCRSSTIVESSTLEKREMWSGEEVIN